MGDQEKIVEQSILRAKQLFKESNALPKTIFLNRIEPLLENEDTKFFLIKLLDTSLRPLNTKLINQHILSLFTAYPNHSVLFNSLEKKLIQLYKSLGKFFPSISVPLIKTQIKNTTNTIIFEVNSPTFKQLSTTRKYQQVKQNINLIGEALLGEEEAKVRILAYQKLIKRPDVDYISIKISTIYSQISSLAFEETISKLKPKLQLLYRTCVDVENKTGKKTFINLDMEEYRDLCITVALFKTVLDEEEFQQVYAGIVLQAYIPDSYNYLIELQEWAKKRVEKGYSGIKIRLVKGANLEMEKVESSLKDWPIATHPSKIATDAQYKKMLLDALSPNNCKAVRLGIASHNLFDISFAIELLEQQNLKDCADFEMLEGLAENLIPSLQKQSLNVLLYTPIIEKDQFLSGIAYLVRRFDEATAKGNYIREAVNMQVNDISWALLESKFIESFHFIPSLNFAPYRTQNRNVISEVTNQSFTNSQNTDWTLLANRDWAKAIKQRWTQPLQIIPASFPHYETERERETFKSSAWNGLLPWSIELATLEDYKDALNQCNNSTWLQLTNSERIQIIKNAGLALEKRRGDLIGIGITEVGKLITELDPEISEAIDFANYYAKSSEDLHKSDNFKVSETGTNLILSPWNFPIAIPAGGIFASLAAGNNVILKPAKQSIACSYLLCSILWEAGVPKDTLHFLPSHSNTISSLLNHPSPFAAVILTGGTDTANILLNNNPLLNLNAETGGKNATIVTPFADKDLAIKHIVESAFGNSGQKCSATSLLILDKEVYEDQHFMNLLVDAVKSKKTGSPWNFDTQVGPMANIVSGHLKNELTNNDHNFLLKGKQESDYFLSPSIVKNVSTSDSSFCNELFGPFLSIVKANNFKHAIEIANSVAYGLTSGLESLNTEEIEYWKKHIQAGNLYINRTTTGAIVKRQPFGGIKLSSFGSGFKAGGRNYLTQFVNTNTTIPINEQYDFAKKDFTKWYNDHFSIEIDESNIRGQANITRYLKPKKVILLLTEEVTEANYTLISLACNILKLALETYSMTTIPFLKTTEYANLKNWNALLPEIDHNTRIRTVSKQLLGSEFLASLHVKGIHIYDSTPLPLGRFELLNYLQEQSISHDFHRYGNLME